MQLVVSAKFPRRKYKNCKETLWLAAEMIDAKKHSYSDVMKASFPIYTTQNN